MANKIAGLNLAFLQILLFCMPVPGFAQLPNVNITLNDGIASEAGQATGSFDVSRTGSTSGALKVRVVVSGTATMTQDYNPDPPMGWIGSNIYQVDIPAGQTSETILITPVQDGLNEGDESVIFTLTGDPTYIVGTSAVSELTIEDDSPVVNLTVSDGTISESGPNPGSFLATRSGGILTKALTIKVVVSGTATMTQDYNPDPPMGWIGSNIYQVDIPAGQTSETILITPVQDGLNEGDESVIFTLKDDATYTVGTDAVSELTIADDSPVVDLTVSDGTISESGPNPGSFLATRSGGILTKALKIKVVVTGTATMTQDYNPDPPMGWIGSNIYQVDIPAGQTSETILITPVQDGLNEGDESVIFTLWSDPTYTAGTSAVSELTIADDSPVVSLTVGTGTSFESRANPGSFIATRSGGVLTKALKIKVVVTGTATIAHDYNLNPAIGYLGSNIYQLEIPPNQTTETFLIEATEDGIDEDDETAIFTLTGDVAYTIGEPVSASITISDYVEGIFKDSFEDP